MQSHWWLILLLFSQFQSTITENPSKLHHTNFGNVNLKFLDDNDQMDDESSSNEDTNLLEINLSEIFTQIKGEPKMDTNDLMQKLMGQNLDLKSGLKLLKNSIKNIISMACISDLVFWMDSLAEYVLAQNDLSAVCKNETKETNCSCAARTQSVIEENMWALEVLDAFGKPSTGILKGNLWMLGDYEQCRQISVSKNSPNHHWEGVYSRVDIFFYKNMSLRPFIEHEYKSVFLDVDTALNTLQMPSSKPECDIVIQIKLGMCLPKTCSKHDVKKIIKAVTEMPQKSYMQRVVCAADVFYHGDKNIQYDTAALILLLFLGILFALVVFGTIYDYKVHAKIIPLKITASLTTNSILNGTDSKNQLNSFADNKIYEFADAQNMYPFTTKVLLAFSLIANSKKIFDMTSERGSGRITCLHGVRALSIIWVIFAHSYSNGMFFVDNFITVLDMPKYILNQIVLNGSLSVDAFFLLSGTLLAYLWLKEMKKTDGKKIKDGQTWFMFYLHRYLRLTPVYALALAIEIILVKYLGDGPMWSVIGLEQGSCTSGWWTNLLYINNFIDLKEMCMVWSWYLANDMQFFFFSPPILITLWLNHVIGIILIIVLLVGFTLLRGFLIISNPSFPPISILFNDFHKLQEFEVFSRSVYIKPYCRCGPYLIGLLLGAILFRSQLKAQIPKIVKFIGWILASIAGFIALFGVFEFCKTGIMDTTTKFFYGSMCRTLWAAFIAWTIYICAVGHGGIVNRILSSRKWRPISRLSFCAYLVHPALLLYYYSIQSKPIHYEGHYQIIMYFFGHMVVTFLLAFILSCGFEMPMITLEKELFKRGPNYGRLMPSSNTKNTMPQTDAAESALNIKI